MSEQVPAKTVRAPNFMVSRPDILSFIASWCRRSRKIMMRCSQLPLTSLFALCFCILRCSAFGIRSPPPLYGDITAAQECSGHLDGWKWNRCVLDGAVVWTAAAFGHMQVSTVAANVTGFGFPSTMGSHVQYTPFSIKQPFAVSGDSLESQSIKQQLPPIVFALYIQSEVLKSSLWNQTMTCLLDAAIDKDHTLTHN